jgi:hypothetical protein
MSVGADALTAVFWRIRRWAAHAGLVFSVLFPAAIIMLHVAPPEDSMESLRSNDRGAL